MWGYSEVSVSSGSGRCELMTAAHSCPLNERNTTSTGKPFLGDADVLRQISRGGKIVGNPGVMHYCDELLFDRRTSEEGRCGGGGKR